jgi:hypothetical protein
MDTPRVERGPRYWLIEDEPVSFTREPTWEPAEYVAPGRSLASFLLRSP